MSIENKSLEYTPQESPKNDYIDVKTIPLSEAIYAFKRVIKNDKPLALRKLLKDREDIDVNMDRGWAIIYAIENDLFKVFKILVKHPDINLDIRNGAPLLSSIENERYEIFKYLLRYGATINIDYNKNIKALKDCCDKRFNATMLRHGFTYLKTNIPSYIQQY
jgi:hypothetical protein